MPTQQRLDAFSQGSLARCLNLGQTPNREINFALVRKLVQPVLRGLNGVVPKMRGGRSHLVVIDNRSSNDSPPVRLEVHRPVFANRCRPRRGPSVDPRATQILSTCEAFGGVVHPKVQLKGMDEVLGTQRLREREPRCA
jgi:hypothetical protein